MATRSAITVVGLDAVLRDFRKLPPETNKAIREGSKAIADRVAGEVRGKGDAQAVPLTGSTRAMSDRIPSIKFGGQKKSGLSGGARVNDLMGANFGAGDRSVGGFPPKVKPDYYVYATIEARKAWITETWVKFIGDVMRTVDRTFTDRR